MDSPQREGTRAWHAHIGLEQSNVARVERADLLVLLVVFVIDDWPPRHFSLAAASAAPGVAREGAFVRGERPLLATLKAEARAPPPPARSGRWALPSHLNKTTTHSRVWSSRRAVSKANRRPSPRCPLLRGGR